MWLVQGANSCSFGRVKKKQLWVSCDLHHVTYDVSYWSKQIMRHSDSRGENQTRPLVGRPVKDSVTLFFSPPQSATSPHKAIFDADPFVSPLQDPSPLILLIF